MKRCAVCLLLPVLFLLLPGASAAAEKMKPGMWEITSTMEMPGMPFQPPPQTIRHCYTAQDVQQSPVPSDSSCEVSSLKQSGNKVNWVVDCSGEMSGRGKGEIVYQGDSAYSGTMSMEAEGMTMKTKYKAKRIGDCK